VKVAVVAHSGKTLGGGLGEFRRVLEAEGIVKPLWFEVSKSRKAPERVRRAVDKGADLVFVWGGDGMVQRCVDVLAGSSVTVAILPAGTANLLATNVGIPQDVTQAVAVGLRGERRKLDLARFNGERFAVMAGVGFDAAMIRGAGVVGSRSVSAGPPTSGPDHRAFARSRSGPTSRSMASAGSRARRAAFWSATWANSSAVSMCSKAPVRMTDCLT
jgi:diacylglycerol kinase family enzyme